MLVSRDQSLHGYRYCLTDSLAPLSTLASGSGHLQRAYACSQVDSGDLQVNPEVPLGQPYLFVEANASMAWLKRLILGNSLLLHGPS